jgi:hypothetical protein
MNNRILDLEYLERERSEGEKLAKEILARKQTGLTELPSCSEAWGDDVYNSDDHHHDCCNPKPQQKDDRKIATCRFAKRINSLRSECQYFNYVSLPNGGPAWLVHAPNEVWESLCSRCRAHELTK